MSHPGSLFSSADAHFTFDVGGERFDCRLIERGDLGIFLEILSVRGLIAAPTFQTRQDAIAWVVRYVFGADRRQARSHDDHT
jgi:hypothetical protein